MARGASPDVGSMKAVAEEQPSESRCLARDALLQEVQYSSKTAGRQSSRPKRTLAQSLEELGSNQQLEGSVSGRAGFEPAVGLIPLRRFSKPVHSASLPPVRGGTILPEESGEERGETKFAPGMKTGRFSAPVRRSLM